MGGQIACAYAVRYPDEVLSLTLCDAAGISEPTVSELGRLLSQGRNPLVVESPSDYDRLLSFVCSNVPSIPGFIKAAIGKEAALHRTFNEKVFKDLQSKWVNLEPLLPQVRCPVLIIWGDQDRVIDVSCVPVFEHGLNNAHSAILHGCGHLPMFERPEETVGYMKEFLSQFM
jgi:pimeloyl-ACP methyl ester carboxylesterase